MENQQRNEKMETLLITLLDCGYADLNVLLPTKYDMYDIIERAQEFTQGIPKLNDLLYAMLQLGLDDIYNYIDENKDEIREGLSEEDQKEFDSIEFEPHEDFQLFINSIDTHVWYEELDKQPYYEKYFQKALDHFEEMTDFNIGY